MGRLHTVSGFSATTRRQITRRTIRLVASRGPFQASILLPCSRDIPSLMALATLYIEGPGVHNSFVTTCTRRWPNHILKTSEIRPQALAEPEFFLSTKSRTS